MDRKQVNLEIRNYYQKIRASQMMKDSSDRILKRDPITKKKKPSFTRHNGKKILRLKDRWRKPKGSHGNKITRPKIGYKNAKDHRFRKSNGLLVVVINNPNQMIALNETRKLYEVFTIARTVGAKKRKIILDEAISRNIPLYITR